jgi:NADPH-dependent F420 reductase
MTGSLFYTLAILGGTGNLGPGLALRWANAGYKIVIGSRKKEKAQRVAAELNEILGRDDIQGMENNEAAEFADVSVLTTKASAHQAAIASLKGSLKDKILIDTTARVDFRDPKPPKQPSAARMAQEVLGSDVRVVAALQTVPASSLRENLDTPLNMDVLVCSDDLSAAKQVIKLIEGAGLNAYYAGGLDNSIVLEGLVALLISTNKHYQSKEGSLQVSGIHK